MFESTWKKICNIANCKDYHILSDSYTDQCIKEFKKMKRSEAEPVEFTNPAIVQKTENF